MAEEVSTETFNNYKFLTIPELKSLSLAHLVGKTNLLRPYMHGYFVASKLYDQARLIANPYIWEEDRMRRIQEKIEKERASRIRGHKQVKVKVNQKELDRLRERDIKRGKADPEAKLVGDPRFNRMFEDEECIVVEHSREFQVLNPSTRIEGKEDNGMNKDHTGSDRDSGDEDEDESDSHLPIRARHNEVVMRTSSSTQRQQLRTRDSALGSRTQKAGRVNKNRQGNVVGERNVTFVPESKKRKDTTSQVIAKRSGTRRSASGNTFRKL